MYDEELVHSVLIPCTWLYEYNKYSEEGRDDRVDSPVGEVDDQTGLTEYRGSYVTDCVTENDDFTTQGVQLSVSIGSQDTLGHASFNYEFINNFGK